MHASTILQQVVIIYIQTSNNPKPKYIVMDFEIGAICANKHIFGDSVQIKGCFFTYASLCGEKCNT
jgi:hypothetical protein